MMNVSYEKLFKILNDRGISKTALGDALELSSATLAKLSKDEQVAMSTLIGICEYLNVQPGDIMELKRESDEESLLYRLTEEKMQD